MANVLLFCMYSISQKDVHVSRSLSSNQVECIICITCIICIACIVCSGGSGYFLGNPKRWPRGSFKNTPHPFFPTPRPHPPPHSKEAGLFFFSSSRLSRDKKTTPFV